MPTTIVTDITLSADCRKTNAVWATARAAAAADSSSKIGPVIGVDFAGGNYDIWRLFLLFNTSAVPQNATIISARLRLYLQADNNLIGLDISALTGYPGYPSNPVVVTDFDITHYTYHGVIGQFGALAAYNDFINIPVSLINKGGMTKFCLSTPSDILNVAPIATLNGQIDGPSDVNPPILQIIWNPGGGGGGGGGDNGGDNGGQNGGGQGPGTPTPGAAPAHISYNIDEEMLKQNEQEYLDWIRKHPPPTYYSSYGWVNEIDPDKIFKAIPIKKKIKKEWKKVRLIMIKK